MAAHHLDMDPRPSRWWIAGLAVVVLFMSLDVVLDWGEGAHPGHIGTEFAGSVLLFVIAVAMWRRREARIGSLRTDLSRSRDEAARWRAEAQRALEGLGEALDRQFDRWALTPAEREVALLLLKGLSMKEIAEVRETSDRTVRDQARAVYRKGDLGGRHELSAFFLEDLLLPTGGDAAQASKDASKDAA